MDKECNNLLSFIADELSLEGKKTFAEHLKHCRECTREYEQMTEAWDSLKWDFAEVEPPELLKTEVMNFIFEKEKKSRKAKLRDWIGNFRRQFTPVTIVIAALSFILLFSNVQLKNELDLPIEVSSTLFLKSADETTASGQAFILQQGEARRLVVQLSNLPPLQGSEVYQVWLLHDGERANAGIFKPNETGEGVLTFNLAQNDQFDQIGITKEPDEFSTQPRGKKIVGSS
ncbi:anti-sigma factor [Lederbergia citrea]|uniref:Anti-sigma factor n=1 Tax=Lederbergia citrea TaxID=2833581 RepID=A0A942UK70_9BACI|nr:anti-sigma factor [Lederbergia citrea]MBS4178485.1 anti-sigma factor [Lederbergia citrea]MBS4205157.1 anti-sigma factor [Lederbergia citrea]MBS4222981.1 anti-sigma factor [Lederbergia citrea]